MTHFKCRCLLHQQDAGPFSNWELATGSCAPTSYFHVFTAGQLLETSSLRVIEYCTVYIYVLIIHKVSLVNPEKVSC
jgi:hypothetical protein